MIGKIRKGGSFKNCINYVLGKDKAQLIAVNGVLLGNAGTIIRSFDTQRLLKPEVAKPVGHISLSYSPQDAPRLTDRAMVNLAEEYMSDMGISNTQYIIVRHNDREHPHCHIVFNRIGNDGKVISDKSDFYRNGQVTKKLKQKYCLTFGEGKALVNRSRLREPDKTKYEIHRAVESALSKSLSWNEFVKAVYKQGVRVTPKFKGNTKEIQGISFEKNGYSFKGSEIDRKFSFGNLDRQIKRNAEKAATRTEQVIRTGLDGVRHVYSQKVYTPPPTENVSIVFSNLFDGLFEPYYSNTPDDALIRDMDWRIRKKKKKLGRGL